MPQIIWPEHAKGPDSGSSRNHDVDRKLITPTAAAIEDKLARSTSEAAVAQYYDDDESRQALLKRHIAYSDFCRTFLGVDAASSTSWSRVFSKPVLGRIRVDGLNTSWLCRGDDDHRRLLVGQSQLTDVMKSHGDADLRITLMHHPLAALMEFDEVNTTDYLKQNTDIVLRGHLHRAETSIWNTNTGGFLELAAGSLHDGHAAPNRFSVLDIPDDLSHIRVSTYLWQNGRWILDRNLYQTHDGIGVFPLKERVIAGAVPPRPIVPRRGSGGPPSSDDTIGTSDSLKAEAKSVQANAPRFQHVANNQDLAIRQRDLEDAVAHLRATRRLVIQKDPGSRYEGFVACILGELQRSSTDKAPPAFHFRCAGVANGKELQNAIELATGCPLTLFGNSLRESSECVVILDDLDFANSPSNLDGPTIDGTLEALHDFCPQMMLVRVTALPCPPANKPLHIGALDLLDTRSYLMKSSRPVHLSSPIDYARVHRATGGVAVYLDEFIAALAVADLESKRVLR